MTDLQRIYPVVIFLALIIACAFFVGCTGTSPQPAAAPSASTSSPLVKANANSSANSSIVRVEVFHFHGNHQCYSCTTVGDLAEQTVNTNFKDELASGRLVFAHVNAELPENAVLAKKYGVTGSSLWIGVYNGTAFSKEEDIRVWYLINNKDSFSAHLSEVITMRLDGDFS